MLRFIDIHRLRGVELDATGAPVAPSDAVALLAEYGRECAGAVVVVPSGEAPSTGGHPSSPLSDDELAELKPTTVWPHSAENEALVLVLSPVYRQVAFRALVGDEDGHGKNYSLIHAEGGLTAAPLYDSLCTLAYPDLSGTMGTPIGTQRSLAKVDRQGLVDEARAMGIPAAAAAQPIDELIEGLRSGTATLDPALTRGWPAEHIVETILARVQRLEDGQPLGGAKPARPPKLTLDAATAKRRR